MQDNNPYQPPSSDVIHRDAQEDRLGEIVTAPAGHGYHWIRDGFRLFKGNAGVWIGMIVVYLLIMIVLSMIPLMNLLLTLIAPCSPGG